MSLYSPTLSEEEYILLTKLLDVAQNTTELNFFKISRFFTVERILRKYFLVDMASIRR